METIIVSACLLGDKCRYDGKGNYNEKVKFLREHFNIVPICPEQFGGLSTPRDPSELRGDNVISDKGKDVTKNFEKGRDDVLNIVRYLHIRKAVLADKSPSCGVKQVYNGKFNGTLIDGQGLTTRALIGMGIECYTIEEVEKLIDKTPKEIFEEKEAAQKIKDEERAKKAELNAHYSKLDNKAVDNFRKENIKPYGDYKKELGVKDEPSEESYSSRGSYSNRSSSYNRDRSSSYNRGESSSSYSRGGSSSYSRGPSSSSRSESSSYNRGSSSYSRGPSSYSRDSQSGDRSYSRNSTSGYKSNYQGSSDRGGYKSNYQGSSSRTGYSRDNSRPSYEGEKRAPREGGYNRGYQSRTGSTSSSSYSGRRTTGGYQNRNSSYSKTDNSRSGYSRRVSDKKDRY